MAQDSWSDQWHRGSWSGWYGECPETKALREQAKIHEEKLDFLRVQMDQMATTINSLQLEITELRACSSTAQSSTAHSSSTSSASSTARSNEAAAPSPSPTPPRLPSPSRGPLSAPSRTEKCVHRGAGNVVVDRHDPQLQGHDLVPMYNWLCHLQSTLFALHLGPTWEGMYDFLHTNECNFKLSCVQTKGNRSFLLVCPHCWAGCRGKYGTWCGDPAAPALARQALTNFVFGTDAAKDGEDAAKDGQV